MRSGKLYRNFFKRGLDVIVAATLLLLFSPLILILCLLNAFDHRGRFLFSQERIGKNGRIFKLLKLTTIKPFPHISGRQFIDPVAKTTFTITPLGQWLRNHSLDELPQLINVLKGDLSLIGPRPLLPEYISYFDEDEKRRHIIRPGISGLAQVNGRNGLNWTERLSLDTSYVDNLSFWLDLRIGLKTLFLLFKNDGVVMSESLIDYKIKLRPEKA